MIIIGYFFSKLLVNLEGSELFFYPIFTLNIVPIDSRGEAAGNVKNVCFCTQQVI